VSRPVTYRGRRVRALRIGDADDVALLTTISRGEFATAGFRNRDLRRLLPPAKVPARPRRVRPRHAPTPPPPRARRHQEDPENPSLPPDAPRPRVGCCCFG